MSIRNIKRWQWILVSLLVGLLFGYIQHLPREDWQKVFGDTITQQQFEEGLVREQRGMHWFRNLVVYPERVEAGGKSVPIHVVAGEYFNGKLETQNGQTVAIWRPRCYIADGPFQPITPTADFRRAGPVLDYLKSVKGVSFRYAWWRDPRWGMAIWTAASLLVIGVIWPTAINLLAFGSIFRPREEKGVDLSKIRSSPQQPTGPTISEADLAAVQQMGAELEAKLAAEAGSPAASSQPPAEPAPVQTLSASALEAAAEQARDDKEFGREKDDFYPTELHPPHPHDEPS